MIRPVRRLQRGPAVRVALVSVTVMAVSVAAYGLYGQASDDFRDSPYLRVDPDRVLVNEARGYRPCGECHTAEWDVWKDTKHATGFETMHRSESAQDIMQKMNLRVTKRQEALCMRCHYTVGPDRRAVTGVSCESCHGPARDWIDVHNKTGSTQAERTRAADAARQGGMLRPSTDIYAVAANCFECHTVPIERIVNDGGHSTGTSGFELISRVDQIRHNFLGSSSGRPQNRELTQERRRVLFVAGRMLAYEYAVRGMATATSNGRYSTAMTRRVRDTARDLEAVAAAVSIPQVTEVLRIGAGLRMVPDNRRDLEAAADRMRAAGQSFATTANGAALGGLDRLIAGEPAAPPSAAGAQADVAAPTSPQQAASAPAQTAAATVSAPAAAAARPELPGQVRARPAWFPAASRNTIVGVGKCTSCHGEAEDWWYADPHQQTGRRLLGEDPRARTIAELYGIGANAMARGDRICMNCHGTVDEPSRVVREEGVSCESCHGAASAYLTPHENGGNPQHGMTALKRAEDRAQTCARCHHISDERLIAAGHPSGSRYDIAQAMTKIVHWPGRRPERGRQRRNETYPQIGDAALRSAFTAATSGRPIPSVTVVAPPAPSTPLGGAPARTPAARGAAVAGPRGSALPPRTPASVPARGGGDVTVDGGSATGADADTRSPEDVLLLVKQRLQRIYAALGRGN